MSVNDLTEEQFLKLGNGHCALFRDNVLSRHIVHLAPDCDNSIFNHEYGKLEFNEFKGMFKVYEMFLVESINKPQK